MTMPAQPDSPNSVEADSPVSPDTVRAGAIARAQAGVVQLLARLIARSWIERHSQAERPETKDQDLTKPDGIRPS